MTEKKREFERGDQIAYIPLHADGNLNHPDVEFGFVTSQKGDVVYCRYYRKGEIGYLRTVANSEGTPVDMVVPYKSVRQGLVQYLLAGIEGAEMALGGGDP